MTSSGAGRQTNNRMLLLPIGAVLLAHGAPPPGMDDLWAGAARFTPIASFPVGAPGFASVNAGTRVVVSPGADHTWYLFGRADSGPTPRCPGGEISINVRASADRGRSWGTPSALAAPDAAARTCQYADGSAYFDAAGSGTWHYLVQVNTIGVGWELAHFYRSGDASPLGAWTPDPANPVVKGGQLFGQICAGPGKHCPVGTVDEGTPQIVEKVGGDYYVTFHGYDYAKRAAVRGVARTPDFVSWNTTGAGLPGDAIFAAADCEGWNVTWAAGGCIGSGEASILRDPRSGYMYEVIEAADGGLTCDTSWGGQWWPLGLVRSRTWAPSPRWEQMPRALTPFVGGPAGGEPRVGCSVQYNSLHADPGNNGTYLAFWDVSFHPANGSDPFSTWHLYELVWGKPVLPMPWPGPPQQGVDCSTADRCRASCPGFVECAADGWFYCCAAPSQCAREHACAGTPGLLGCACGAG